MGGFARLRRRAFHEFTAAVAALRCKSARRTQGDDKDGD
jgi:hypothetical protein